MFKRYYPAALAALIAFVGCVAVFAPAQAQADAIRWQRYDVDITVLPNGDARVVETQTIQFVGGPFAHGYAQIPKHNTDGIEDFALAEAGTPYQLVSTEPDEPNTFFPDVNYRNVEVLWKFPPTNDTTRTFQLSYTLKNVVMRDAAGDHIGIIAISTDLDEPVYESTVTVHLPAPLVADPESLGAVVQWQTTPDAKGITYTAENGVPPSKGIITDLFMEHDPAATKPEWQVAEERAEAERQRQREIRQAEQARLRLLRAQVDLAAGAISIALLLLVPGALYGVWYFQGRDPSALLAPDYLDAPPSSLPPGLVGVLVDEKADMRDLTATVVDLARRGYLQLEEIVANSYISSATSVQVKKSTTERPQGMRVYESLLYSALFASQESVRFDNLPYGFFDALPRIENALYEDSVTEGLFRSSPGETRGLFQGLGISVIVLGVIAGIIAGLGWGSLTTSVIWPAVPIVLFGLGLIILGPVMPARTKKGAEEAAKWRAFQKYLGNIKQYGGVDGVAEKFELYLPYALVFGLERRWVGAFTEPRPAASNVVVPVPRWYQPRTPSQPLTVPSMGGSPNIRNATAVPGSSTPIGPGSSSGTTAPLPDLNSVGQGFAGGLNQLGNNFVQSLNTVGESFSTPRSPSGSSSSSDWFSSMGSNSSGSGGSWGGSSRSSSSHRSSSSGRSSSSSRSSFGSSRGSSGGRSSSGSRSSGGGRRGFR